MVSNLRVEFCERQHKRLSKSIVINPTPSKKACLEPTPTPPSIPALLTTVVTVTLELNEKPSFANDISYHVPKRPFVVLNSFNKESFECMNFSPLRLKPTYVPSREEISELLNLIPSFIEREPLVQNIGVLFPAIQWIPVEIDENPNRSFITRLPYSTLDITIARILHMQDYIAFETTKVVGRFPHFHLFLP